MKAMDLSMIRVMIADDHPMMREGIAATLVAHGAFDIVARAVDGIDAIELYDRMSPDVALIDLQMPGKDGLEAIREIRSRHPGANLIVLSTYCGDARIASALKSGARTYLMKNVDGAELAATVREVHEGWHVVSQSVRADVACQYAGTTPTPRELDVLRLASNGHSNREIAAALFITEATVKAHMSTVLMKLGAADRTHAVAIGARRGFIEL